MRWNDRLVDTRELPKVTLAFRCRLCAWSGRSEHHLGQRACPRKQAGHLIASNRVRNLLTPYKRGAVHICNLYTERLSAAEVATHFGVANPIQSNAGAEVYPGATGIVVREVEGRRVMQTMKWGWPMKFKGMSDAAKPKAVNNIADLRKSTWIGNARKPEWRCLIPLTAFAEAEGPKGARTRTWFNVKDQPIFAWAGLWREDREYGWGAVYSGVMTDCNEATRPVHDRMPVLLHPDEYDHWLNGSFDDALAFQLRCFPDDLIEMTRTDELWIKPKPKTTEAASLL